MEMRTVYRYEDSSGRGPYRAHNVPFETSGKWREMCDSHSGDHHPSWSYTVLANADLVYEMPEEVLYSHLAACDSREALDAWFDGWQDVLDQYGFKVVEYTVPAENVVDGVSGMQCAFLPV